MKRLNEKNLAASMAFYVEHNDAFTLLASLTDWLRRGKAKNAAIRINALLNVLQDDNELAKRTAIMLCRWLCSVRLYPLLISAGIFSRDGFASELLGRWYEAVNPAYKDPSDLRDVFSQLFAHENDGEWIDAIPTKTWLRFLHLMMRYTPEHDRETVQQYMLQEGLHAIEMLSVWVAAEELDPDLIRLDKKLLDRDSPFVALNREVSYWVLSRWQGKEFDTAHLGVMMDQCHRQVETLRKKGTGAGAGSSLSVAHLLERLEQTLNRMTLLMAVFMPQHISPRKMLALTGTLAKAAAEQHSLYWLWKRSIKMLSRSITQNTSSHGEHYITRNKKEYMGMLYSAAGGGVLIALMSLLKIHFGRVIENQFWLSFAEGLNYGLGFALIFILHFTVATKQPAMTASRFAALVERTESGKAVNMKLAQLLVDVFRSQAAAVAGNVGVAVFVAMMIALIFRLSTGMPLLTADEVQYQIKAIDPTRATLWYAAIAGVWLFCSGIISGFFDNRCDYLNMRQRLFHHPILKRMLPEKWRLRLADYWHHNYGSIMGNLCFGMLLGMSGFIGHTTGLPFDIRHVAFSSANVGYFTFSGGGFWLFWQSMVFVLLIGLVNLTVSFLLTLSVALRSRETKIESWWAILQCVGQIMRERPLSLILPTQLPADNAPKKESKSKKDTLPENTNDSTHATASVEKKSHHE
ncbi:MAG: recombinase [Alysiella sp.]|uniref:site-specific recombinase n=1 Tax=Alysiella sp. TaxID=1872483 RepID=UPI0026DAA7DD|nr:recombinase [Alysiella sp.]MDO4434071.1 recombinase [Alysiella sp.]